MGDSELSQPNSNKTLTQALESWFGNFSESLNAVKIGRIEAVNYTNQTVDVQILHKKVKQNFNVRELRDYALLKSVPFVIIGGGGSYLTFPISKGDNCLLFFCDYEIDRWWDTGESLPATFERRHDISDAFALVGVHSLVDLLEGYSHYVQLKYSDDTKIVLGRTINLTSEKTNVIGKLNVTEDATAASLHADNGITGSYVDASGNTLNFVDGILTSVTSPQ